MISGKGLKVEFKGEPCEIVEFQHVKMGRGGAIVRTKMRNIKTGAVLEETFRSGEKLETPGLEERTCSICIHRKDSITLWMKRLMSKLRSGASSLARQ